MLAIMCDLWFKNTKVIEDYVGNFINSEIVVEYITKVVYPFLFQVYFYLNPISKAYWNNNNWKWCLFFRVYCVKWWCDQIYLKEWIAVILLIMCATIWNLELVGLVGATCISIFACGFFGIVGSQIEIECIFNVVGVITNFQCSKLGINNLDCLILVIKNWPNDAHIGCVVNKPRNMDSFLSSEVIIIKEHKKLIKEKELFEEDYDEI